VAKRIVESIKVGGGEAMAIQADITQEDQVKRMFQQMLEAWGSIDILVNNAGCVQKETAVIDMSLADWEYVLRVNLTGQFLCVREAAREFLGRGVVPELSCSAGKIICISSVHDAIPWADHANYAASKGGVRMFMKTLAQELSMHKVRVNSISPGAIKTLINWKFQNLNSISA
jgi:glucose 1-dehydrogenase